MKTKPQRILASLLLLTMIVTPAYAGCGQDLCLGPCTYQELIYGTTFNTNCSQWVYSGTGNAWEKVGNNGWAKLVGTGDVSQTLAITDSYSHMELAFDIPKVVSSPGTERLYVEIVSNGSVVETVAVIYPNTSQVNFSAAIGNYSLQTVAIRFRYSAGATPGNTVFRVDNAAWFGYY
ncbi:MAG TPA: hypothetical protein VF215_15430 [Thermoanaerobaculia bacterium]